MTEPYQITPLESDDPGVAKAKINQIINVVNELLIAQSKTADYLISLNQNENVVGESHYVTRAESVEPPFGEGDWDLPQEVHVGEDTD